MRRLGFSTGALAKADFQRGIQLQASHVDALELSALREAELDPLIDAIPGLELDRFKYVSFHAPSRLVQLNERELIERLRKVAKYVKLIIVHPNVIGDPAQWEPIEDSIALENMDQRSPSARTASEMKQYFEALPRARFCFDIGHARQVDPTLSVAIEFLRAYAQRLAEIHISEVNAASEHVAISSAAMNSFKRISSLIPKDTPAIVESIVGPDQIDDELKMARASLGDVLALATVLAKV